MLLHQLGQEAAAGRNVTSFAQSSFCSNQVTNDFTAASGSSEGSAASNPGSRRLLDHPLHCQSV